MKQLDVSPLPCMEVSDEAPRPESMDEGFVDDSVVLDLLTAASTHGGSWNHAPVTMQAAGTLDYAGWPATTWQVQTV